MKWFKGINNLKDLKKAYRALAMRWHPDHEGGDLKTMQEINAEYDKLNNELPDINAEGQEYQPKERENPEMFRAAVVAVQNLFGVDVELCGNWIWCTGNTRTYKDTFKAAGYKWSANKCAWYWHPEGYRKHGKKSYTMDQIREMHGSSSIRFQDDEKITA